MFGFTKSGHLYELLALTEAKAGVQIPPGVSFHVLRHTYGAWMRRYGGLDRAGLVATRAWASSQGAASYDHIDTTEAAMKAALLPGAMEGSPGLRPVQHRGKKRAAIKKSTA